MNKRKIAHAIAYIDVFMVGCDCDNAEIKDIFKYADTLSSQELVSIVKDSAKRSNINGVDIVLKEIDTPEFQKYIEERMNYHRSILLEV